MSKDLDLTVRLPFHVSASMARAIDRFWHDERLPSRAEAMRRLIEMGLEQRYPPRKRQARSKE